MIWCKTMKDILIEEKKLSLKAFVFLHTQVQMYNLYVFPSAWPKLKSYE